MQKFEYLVKEKSVLDIRKSIFHDFEMPSLGKIWKNSKHKI